MAQLLQNTGFESSTISGDHVGGSNADSAGKWAFSPNSGVYATGSKFNGLGTTLLAPHGGSNAAYMFASNGSRIGAGLTMPGDSPVISQDFLATAASYTLSFYSAQQNSSTSACTLTVTLISADGSDYREFVVTPTTSYAQTSIPLGPLLAQVYTIRFTAKAPIQFGTQGSTTYTSYVSGMVYLDDTSIV